MVKSEKTISVNGYKIKYNRLWKKYGVSHPKIGANIATFNTKLDAIKYAKKG